MVNKKQILGAGLGLGAGLMYFFDPDRGRRRRASLRDTVTHAAHVTRQALGKTSRDLSHRVNGLTSEISSTFKEIGRAHV